MPPSNVVVDGSNIATEGRNTPSLDQLDQAVRQYLDEHPGANVTVVVDASFGGRLGLAAVRRLNRPNHCGRACWFVGVHAASWWGACRPCCLMRARRRLSSPHQDR